MTTAQVVETSVCSHCHRQFFSELYIHPDDHTRQTKLEEERKPVAEFGQFEKAMRPCQIYKYRNWAIFSMALNRFIQINTIIQIIN